MPFNQPGSKTRPLLISSGKGGVGKSSVTTNLAVALAARGHSVGVVDADIYGFSIPRMLGANNEPVVIDQMLLPSEAWGVRCISIGYFVPEGQAVIWRGPMLHKALEQFLADVFWDDPDFLLVDMPPGTGDIAISLSQYLPRGEVYVVTTPQPAAQQVARLSAAMAAKVNLTVRGVIENMSWFTGDDGKRYELFGRGGGADLAAELDVPLLAQLPLVPELRQGGDDGRPIAAVAPDSEAGAAFHVLAERIAVDLRPKKIFSDALRVSVTAGAIRSSSVDPVTEPILPPPPPLAPPDGYAGYAPTNWVSGMRRVSGLAKAIVILLVIYAIGQVISIATTRSAVDAAVELPRLRRRGRLQRGPRRLHRPAAWLTGAAQIAAHRAVDDLALPHRRQPSRHRAPARPGRRRGRSPGGCCLRSSTSSRC